MPTYCYEFDKSISFDEALETLTLSRIAVASALGESRLRLETNQRISHTDRRIELGAATEAGNMLNRVYTGYLAREFPRGSFKVATIPHTATVAADRINGTMSG